MDTRRTPSVRREAGGPARAFATRRIQAPVSLTNHFGSQSSHTLSPELTAEAVRRLGWLGLVYCAGNIAAHFGRGAVLVVAGRLDPTLRQPDPFAVAAVAMGLAVYVVVRRGLIPPKHLLDLGLVFQVAGAFGLAINEFSNGVPPLPAGSVTVVPAECVWIVMYPLVVPNTPKKVLAASLLAACTGPAAVVLSAAIDGRPIEAPRVLVTYFLTTNYICAVIAYVVARIVHRFNVRLKHARDIGSYELIEPIGHGGMGEVWQARHRLLKRPAAIKLIRSDMLGPDPRSRDALVQRFEREARDTAALRSPHTITVYDFGVSEDGDFYYVMELLEGLSLERLVRTYGPIDPARTIYLLRQICHSLGEAHARGLVHRDVKPANIFVCRLGPDVDFVKVLDFGLVKHTAAGQTVTMLTVEGTTAGTPAYMAPEIALGHPDVDARADVYSLGCVAYYLLTGQTVFSGETPIATAVAHVQNQPEPPSARSELVIPDALETLVMECLAKDPANRPATAAAVGQRLAASVPLDRWTPAAAHDWWERHQPVSAATQAAPTPSAPPRALLLTRRQTARP